jgi:HSP20 family molecular chaperone IbpA
MTLLQQEVLQQFEQSYSTIAQLFEEWRQISGHSTFWIGDWGSVGLSGVTVQDLEQLIILEISLQDIELSGLEIQVSPETVLLQGEKITMGTLPGYYNFQFSQGNFQSLIPLPCRINPEEVQAELGKDCLTLTLRKLGHISRQRFKLSLETPAPMPALSF